MSCKRRPAPDSSVPADSFQVTEEAIQMGAAHLHLKPTPWRVHLAQIFLHKCQRRQPFRSGAHQADTLGMDPEVVGANLQRTYSCSKILKLYQLAISLSKSMTETFLLYNTMAAQGNRPSGRASPRQLLPAC